MDVKYNRRRPRKIMKRICIVFCCECNKSNSSSTQPSRGLKPQKWFSRDSSSALKELALPMVEAILSMVNAEFPRKVLSKLEWCDQGFRRINLQRRLISVDWLTWQSFCWSSLLRALFCVISILSCLQPFKWMCLVLALVDGYCKMISLCWVSWSVLVIWKSSFY